jgi:hypothetical protein
MLRALFSATILAGAFTGSAMAQGQDAGCVLPSEPKGIPAALDAAISGPADKDRACMKTLLIPEARMMFVSLGADGAPSYRLETLDDWIARVKALGHATLEEKQLKFHIERYGNIAHIWSSYTLHSDGKQVARGINSIQAIKETGGWRVVGIMVQAESATAPLPMRYRQSNNATTISFGMEIDVAKLSGLGSRSKKPGYAAPFERSSIARFAAIISE